MNNAINYAKKFNLVPGVALTAAQMSELTTDMVWFVNQEVTLPSGKKLNVLTPKVYLAANQSHITPSGALISAESIVGIVNDLNNSGMIMSRELTNLHSRNDIQNNGIFLGANVNLNAEQNLVNVGGKILAVENLSLHAGKDIDLSATMTQSYDKKGGSDIEHTDIDRKGEIAVSGANGTLSMTANGNITVKATDIRSESAVDLQAKNHLTLTTEQTKNKERYDFNANHYYDLAQETEVGSTVSAKNFSKRSGWSIPPNK